MIFSRLIPCFTSPSTVRMLSCLLWLPLPLPPFLGHSDIIRTSSEHMAPPLPVLAVLNCPRGTSLFPSLSSDHR